MPLLCWPYLRLYHSWPLGAQRLDRLEEVHHALVPHALQHDAEGDEDASPAHTSTAGEERRGACLLYVVWHRHTKTRTQSLAANASSEKIVNRVGDEGEKKDRKLG